MNQINFELKWDDVKNIRTDLLQTFPYSGETQHIRYETQEFSAVCPFSGLPDLASLIIEYIPSNLCIELKSLKLYLISYRNVGIFQEQATDKIFSDLWTLIKPQKLHVKSVYATRGGINSTCFIEK